MTSAEWTPWASAPAQAASTVGEHGNQEIGHRPITVTGPGRLAPPALPGGRQHPVREGEPARNKITLAINGAHG